MLEAEKSLNAQQLKAIIVDSSYVKGMPAGMVLEQTPVGGSRVKEGRAVYLTVTTSDVPLVKLPDLIDNSSLRQAAAKLKSIGFRLTEPEYIAGEQDWVYGIKYRGTGHFRQETKFLMKPCLPYVSEIRSFRIHWL